MNANPRRRPSAPEPEPEPRSIGRLLVGRRAGLGAMAVLLGAVVVGTLVWQRVAGRVREDAILHPEAIVLVGQAPWVKADIRAEALRSASLDHGLPLTDPELPNRLARAFDMHPWVRQVVGVRLGHPPSATVEVRCREPAAMVGVAGGLLAIDAEGVVLPSADFTPEVAAVYPRLAGIESSPQGPEGALWGDPAVEEGAALASVNQPEWRALGLAECLAVPPASGEGANREWRLIDAQGRVIVFGAAPGREMPGEPSAAVKIARLRALAARAGGGRPVDLRDEVGPTSP